MLSLRKGVILSFLAFIFLTTTAFAQDVPLKATDEYSIELDLELRVRHPPADNVLRYEAQERAGNMPLPYIIIDVRLITLAPDEYRIRIINSDGTFGLVKKVHEGMIVSFEPGFAADIKDGLAPRTFTVFLLSKKREKLSRIEITFDERGRFLINGVQHGVI